MIYVGAFNKPESRCRTLPACLRDLNEAKEAFTRLSRTIDRLMELADECSVLSDEDQAGRAARQDEFVALARVVARSAGRLNYRQPQLSVETPSQARATRMALRHLEPVKATLKAQLEEQEKNIHEAVTATMDFLRIMVDAFPGARSLMGLPDLLRQIGGMADALQPDIRAGVKPSGELH